MTEVPLVEPDAPAAGLRRNTETAGSKERMEFT